MKTILLFGTILIAGSLYGQRTGTDKAKMEFTQYPTVPIEGIEKLGIQVYTADLPFNKDTLRLYLGNMDILKSDVESVSKVGYGGLNEVTLVGGEGDITIEMAIGEPFVASKEQKTSSCMVAKDGCTQYYYEVVYRMPAIVQAKNAEGVLDTWELEPEMKLQFGNEQVEKHKKTGKGSTTSIQVVNYTSEEDLNKAFSKMGEASLVRKGMVNHIGNLAESIYERLFFEETKLKLEIGYGKGRATDYTETEEASANAVAALESEDYSSLKNSITVWESWLERYDADDRKAAVNDKVAQVLHENLSIAYTFTGDFDKARKYSDKALEFAQSGMVQQNEVTRLKEFSEFIDKQEKVKKHNSSLTPKNLVTAPDIKKLLVRRKFNKDIDFLIAEDKYNAIQKNHGASSENKESGEETLESLLHQSDGDGDGKDDNEEISLDGRVENDMLVLSALVDANMKGKALPNSICEYPEIKTIRARNIGLTSLPDCMNELTKLEKLYINNNTFEELPDMFGSMKDLKVLDISNNNLKTLPESIYTLTHLKKIFVSGNQLSDDDMKKLEEALPKTKFK
ncbi:MAG: leucine-rich repeat domain-containing protein [Brumimicrobium sp.]